MQPLASFSLYTFIRFNASRADTMLAGSATPGLSLNDITSLSSDPKATAQVWNNILTNQAFNLGSLLGAEQLRLNISRTYNPSSKLTADNVVVSNGTTGANHITYRSLLSAGDHVIVQYPTYGPLIEEPRDIGCEISYLRLDPAQNWSLDLESLKRLIRPGRTKMLVLNNPVNPTGTHLDAATQRSVIQIAKEHGIIIHCDEIFRPFFHSTDGEAMPPSLNDHADLDYDKIVTTGSLSKCYGLSGVRIGWVCTRSSELYERFTNYKMYSIQSLSQLDEPIATEVLSPRCRPGILQKHLKMAQRNLELIAAFVEKHSSQCEWVRPTAGSVAFVKFKDHNTGEAVDDVDFCTRLVESKKILISPATYCFEMHEDGTSEHAPKLGEFKGRARVHFTTTTDVVERGLEAIGEFLEEEKRAPKANGVH